MTSPASFLVRPIGVVRLGYAMCNLSNVEDRVLHVRGLGAIDKTPVLDIEPRMSGFAPRGTMREPLWAPEIAREHW